MRFVCLASRDTLTARADRQLALALNTKYLVMPRTQWVLGDVQGLH